MNMINFEYILWAYFALNPLYIYLTFEKDKEKVLTNPDKKINLYLLTILNLWLPTALLLWLGYIQAINFTDIGLVFQWDMTNYIFLAILILVLIYFYISLEKLLKDEKLRLEVFNQMKSLSYILPNKPLELKYYIFGVSVTAGICEELLFRGYLLHLFSEQMPVYAAVLLSSIAFGLPHIYQGIVHIFRTMILGIIMAVIYLATDSLILPILLHALLDVYGGALAYVANSRQQELLPLDTTNKPS